MTYLEILKDARELIGDPARWTQDAYARNVDGKTTDPLNPDAVCWCAVGSIIKFTGSRLTEFVLSKYANGMSLISFNDNHTHAEVLSVFDRSIADLEAGNL